MRGAPKWINTPSDWENAVALCQPHELVNVMIATSLRNSSLIRDQNIPPILVSFRTPVNSAVIEQSPYRAIAIWPIEYYVTPSPNLPTEWPDISTVEAFPGCAWNRVVAGTSPPYDEITTGLDIFDSAGALSDFYAIWDHCLSLAKTRGGSTILVDGECYNNYTMTDVRNVALACGQTSDAVRAMLRNIGANLADKTVSIIPNATVLALSTLLHYADACWKEVILGFVDRTKTQQYPITLVCGNETPLGYCRVNDLEARDAIVDSLEIYRPWLKEYWPYLKIGGTIAPWHDASIRTGWMVDPSYIKCVGSELVTANDFVPVFKRLFSSFETVWIYAAQAAGYDPSDPEIAELYNAAIAEALNQ